MSRLYTVLNGLLLLGGVAALIGHAWVLGAVLVVLGGAGMTMELRAARHRSAHIPLSSGPVAELEAIKAQGVQNVNLGNISAAQTFGANGGF